MLIFFNVILILSCIVAAVSIASLIWQKPSKGKMFLIMSLVVALIQCLGYMMEINAHSLGEAMYGVKTEYLGSSYVVCFSFFFICELFDVKLPSFVKRGMFLLQTFIFISVFTTEYHNLYYRNLEFVEGDLYNHIAFAKGPIYWLFMANIVIGMLTVSYVAIRSYRRMGKKWRTQVRAIIFAFQIPILSLFVYLTGITKGYDLMPLAVVAGFTICVVNVLRHNILGLQEDAKEIIVDTLADSLIIVNKDYYFIMANRSAKELFPSLKQKRKMEEFGEQESLILRLFEGRTKEIEIGERLYQAEVIEVKGNWAKNGYLLIFTYMWTSRFRRS